MIADSKAIYSPAQGLGLLERGVLAMLALVDDVPGDWRSAWRLLDGEAAARLDHLPWHRRLRRGIAHAADRDDVLAAAERLRDGLERAGVELVSVRSIAVFPQPFNDGADRWGNKAEALSRWTLAFGRRSTRTVATTTRFTSSATSMAAGIFMADCCKSSFPEYLIEVHDEGLAQSTYRWGPPERRVEIRFCAGGEVVLAGGVGLDGVEISA